MYERYRLWKVIWPRKTPDESLLGFSVGRSACKRFQPGMVEKSCAHGIVLWCWAG